MRGGEMVSKLKQRTFVFRNWNVCHHITDNFEIIKKSIAFSS